MTKNRPGRQSSEYKIGYGRPPLLTQWKSGQSGNSKGRPKGSTSLAACLNRALSEKIAVTERGIAKKAFPRDLIGKSLVHKAIKGDLKALLFIIANERHFTPPERIVPRITRDMTPEQAAEAYAQTRRKINEQWDPEDE